MLSHSQAGLISHFHSVHSSLPTLPRMVGRVHHRYRFDSSVPHEQPDQALLQIQFEEPAGVEAVAGATVVDSTVRLRFAVPVVG